MKGDIEVIRDEEYKHGNHEETIKLGLRSYKEAMKR
jgi:hypothetical protein